MRIGEQAQKMKQENDELHDKIVATMTRMIGGANLQNQQERHPGQNHDGRGTNTATCFSYRGKMNYWHLPEDFEFPKKVDVQTAVRLWLTGNLCLLKAMGTEKLLDHFEN